MDFNEVLRYVGQLLLDTWRPIVEIALMAVALTGTPWPSMCMARRLPGGAA